jgi:hypothetical protein
VLSRLASQLLRYFRLSLITSGAQTVLAITGAVVAHAASSVKMAVQYVGQFVDTEINSGSDTIWSALFGKSYIYKEHFADRDWISDTEVDLYLAVVVVTEKNGCRIIIPAFGSMLFSGILNGRSFSDGLDTGLADIADEYIPITGIAPDIIERLLRCKLPNDACLNALLQRSAAAFLVNKIGTDVAYE